MNLISLNQTCFGCPSQWEGRSEFGNEVYIRYRHGTLSLDINDEEVVSMEIGNGMDGVMNTDDMLYHLKLSYGPLNNDLNEAREEIRRYKER